MPDNELSLPSNTDALMAIVDATSAIQRAPFPVVQVAGGNGANAGTYGPMSGTPDEVAANLPAGRAPITGIFVAYRTEIIAWGTGYTSRDPESDGRPIWSGVLDPQNADDARLVAAAVEAYQFTPGAEKAKFDAVGHPRPSIQFLLFNPKLNDLMIVQAPAHQQTWALTTASLKRLVDPTSKKLGQFPVTLKPKVDPKSNGSHQWNVTSLDVGQLLTDEAKTWWDAYQAWRENAKLDPSKVVTVNEWIKGADKPLTEDIRSKLQACADLKPARK